MNYPEMTTDQLKAEFAKYRLFVDGKVRNAKKFHRDMARENIRMIVAEIESRNSIESTGEPTSHKWPCRFPNRTCVCA